MKKLLISASAGLIILAANGVLADNIPAQHDSIPINTRSDEDQAASPQNAAQHFNALFNSFFNNDPFGGTGPFSNKNFIPLHSAGFSNYARTDMYETKDSIEINVETPGIKKEDIDLEIANNIVTIKYQQKQENKDKDKSYTLNERSVGSFEREFSLPSNANTDKAEAKYKDGVLHISIPKLSEAKVKSKKIDID